MSFPNQVWASDVTDIKLNTVNVYPVAIPALCSRKVLAYSISNTMNVQFCIDGLEKSLMKYGVPAIFNSDQGSQFTSEALNNMLTKHEIHINMDGKGQALDNIYVECLYSKRYPVTIKAN